MDNSIFTKKELSNYMKCSIGMIDNLMKENLPYIKLGRNVKFKKEDIDDYLTSKTITKQ